MAADSAEACRLLFLAVEKDRTDILLELVKSGADPGLPRAQDGASALHVASATGKTDVVRALLRTKAPLDLRPVKGEWAGKRPFDVAKDEKTRRAYCAELLLQVSMDAPERVSALCRGGVPPDAGAHDDGAALHWAATFGRAALCSVLVDLGATVRPKRVPHFFSPARSLTPPLPVLRRWT
jgi:ankyrin repeat protein